MSFVLSIVMQTKQKEPKLCVDRGRFFVWLDGKRHYFTAKGKAEAEVKRKRFLANLWLGNPVNPSKADRNYPPVQEGGYNPPQNVNGSDMLVAELANEFLKYHALRLSKSEIQNFKYAIGYLVGLFGSLPINGITPKKLRTVRDKMVRSRKLCRKTRQDFCMGLRRRMGRGKRGWCIEDNQAPSTGRIGHF